MLSMNDAEDMKRFKAKQLRYKKPIVKDLNLEAIQLHNCGISRKNARMFTGILTQMMKPCSMRWMGMKTKHMNLK